MMQAFGSPSSTPPNVDTLLQKATQLGQRGQLDAAIALCQRVVDQYPSVAKAWHLLGLAALQQRRYPKALEHLKRAIELDSQSAEFYNHLGVVWCELGDIERGIDAYRQSLVLNPQALDTRFNLALSLQKQEGWAEAEAEYREILRHTLDYAPAHYQLGNVLQHQHRLTEAIAQYQEALSRQSRYPEAHYNLGVALQRQGDIDAAIAHYQAALTQNPQYVEARNAMGTILQERGQAQAAIAIFEHLLNQRPTYVPTLLNLANLQLRLGQLDKAEATYRKILGHDPSHIQALDSLIVILRRTCQWQELSSLEQKIIPLVEKRIAQGLVCEASPYNSLFLPIKGYQQRAIAENYAQILQKKMATEDSSSQASPNLDLPKIRLGYVSGDFRLHAVAQLILRLFALHDRTRFEVYAYSLGPDDGSSYRQTLMADCDWFREVQGWSPKAIAQQIRQDQIHVLIDLAGYTDHSCPEVFALRPAPVQINYLGYPGTVGASYMDYIIVDPVLVPPSLANTVAEQCLYLPNSYQLNNNHQPLPRLIGQSRTVRC